MTLDLYGSRRQDVAGPSGRDVEESEKSFKQFHDEMISNGVIDPKTTFMIEMGAAMAVGCYPCMEILTGMAGEKGVSEEELETIQAIVMAVSAGKVFNQYREVCARLEPKANICCA